MFQIQNLRCPCKPEGNQNKTLGSIIECKELEVAILPFLPEAKTILGQMLLHAVSSGLSDPISFLIQAKADLQTVNGQGETALHLAVRNSGILTNLLHAKANLILNNKTYKQKRTALHYSVLCGSISSTLNLIAAKADLMAQCEDKQAPIHLAVWANRPEHVKLLIEANSQLESRTKFFKHTPLHFAARFDSFDCLQILLSAKANTEAIAPPNFNRTPLHCAIYEGNNRCVAELLQAKANPCATEGNDADSEALHLAAYCKRPKCILSLLSAKASVNAISMPHQRTPLHVAAISGCTKSMVLLLEAKSNINAYSECRHTSLHFSVWKKHSECTRALLTFKANLEATTDKSMTPLHFAVGFSNELCLQQLLKAKACVDSKDSDGHTPLHSAILSDQVGIAKQLVAAGAYSQSCDNEGAVALLYASTQMRKAITTEQVLRVRDTNCRMEYCWGLLGAMFPRSITYSNTCDMTKHEQIRCRLIRRLISAAKAGWQKRLRQTDKRTLSLISRGRPTCTYPLEVGAQKLWLFFRLRAPGLRHKIGTKILSFYNPRVAPYSFAAITSRCLITKKRMRCPDLSTTGSNRRHRRK